MTETINFSIESEDLKEFKETTGMSLTDCVKILMNSVKYGSKMERHELIEVICPRRLLYQNPCGF